MLKRWGGGAPLGTKTPITNVVEAWGVPRIRIFSRLKNHVSWSVFDPEDTSAIQNGRLAGRLGRTHHCDGDHTPTNRVMGHVTARKIDLRETSANMVQCYRDGTQF